MGKIIEIDEAETICRKAREEHKIVVFTNGCFDIIHPGHIECLKKARALGDLLVVGLNTDSSVRTIKGKTRPIFNQSDRAKVLSEISSVDYVVLFDEPTPRDLIAALKPNIVAKGGDYTPEQVVGRETAKNVVIIPQVPGYSTSEIIERIKNG
jgi:D-beta-D-heptose 7-phosphate kinase/D-beta-D-heptose 1-phosphate adenosyltransferase